MRSVLLFLVPIAAWAGAQNAPPSPLAARVLAVHNRERAAVGVPPLRWSPALAASAASYAPTLAAIGHLQHSPKASRPGQGENLALGAAGYHSAEWLAGFWAEEKKDFVNGAFDRVSRTGNWLDVSHYTQMIWRTTTEVGCAEAIGGKRVFLVCRYSPKGNRDGATAH